MGASVEVDDAGERVGGETGNLIARFAGNAAAAPPLLLSCHMDTVGPAAAIHPVVDGDLVRTDGTSVLGGDDKAGIVAILEAIRAVRGGGVPHGDIEVVLTICEESGLHGGQALRHGPAARAAVGSCWTSTACPSSSRAPRGQSARVHRPRARRPRGDLPRAGPLRHPDGGGGDRRDAASAASMRRPPRISA